MSFSKSTLPFFTPKDEEEREAKERLHRKYSDFTSTLLVDDVEANSQVNGVLRKYNGYWFPEVYLPFILAARDHFRSQPDDILIASYPKCGTTWLKALVFSIVRRKKYTYSPVNNPQQAADRHSHPLLTKNPHELVGSLETQVPRDPDLPRIFHSHTPLSILPESIKESAKLVYVCRNPKDNLVSLFHFVNTFNPPQLNISREKIFEAYIDGKYPWCPVWDHMLEFWNESRRNPQKVLFLKYEDLKIDTVEIVRRLAEFLGFPFSDEEEKEGVIEGIVKLCSFENLSSLDVNKSGKLSSDLVNLEKSSFFRHGNTGDWKSDLTMDMAESLDRILAEKLDDSGLFF